MGRRSENVLLLIALIGVFVLSFKVGYFDAIDHILLGIVVIYGVVNVVYGEVRMKKGKKKIAEVLKGFSKLKPDDSSVLHYKTHDGRYDAEYVFRAYNQLLSVRRSEAEMIRINGFCTVYKKNDFAVIVDQDGYSFYSKTNYLL